MTAFRTALLWSALVVLTAVAGAVWQIAAAR